MRLIHRIIESILRICRDCSKEPRQFATSTEVPSLVCQVIDLFVKEPAVMKVIGSVIVVGDLHGNLNTLVRIFEELGYPDLNCFVFLGDYIDRGPHSCEIVILVYALKVLFPTKVVLLRGNHELGWMTENYGFRQECLSRFLPHVYSSIVESFHFYLLLPSSTIVFSVFMVV
jgi:protein phosphatase